MSSAYKIIFTFLLGVVLLSLGFRQHETQVSQACSCVFESNLISCVLLNESQDSIWFYSDTGGRNFLYKSGKKKLRIPTKRGNLWEHDELRLLFENNNFPDPGMANFSYLNDTKSKSDGMLGREWFANKVVKIDYSKEQLEVLTQAKDVGSILKLYFKEDQKGNPVNYLARVEMEVEGDTISLLLDTGAQAYLSQKIQDATKQKRLVAISFINASLMNRWHQEHPEWEVFQNGDESFKTKEDIILVPRIKIANSEIGPVAFASRDDYNFKNMSTLFMDAPIQGAIGGNALSHLGTIIIDYPSKELKVNGSNQPE